MTKFIHLTAYPQNDNKEAAAAIDGERVYMVCRTPDNKKSIVWFSVQSEVYGLEVKESIQDILQKISYSRDS